MRSIIRRLRRHDEDGQGLAEYGLILALVAIASVGALTALGNAINAAGVWDMFANL